MFILLNPTLTLSTLVLGYESLVSSLLIIIFSLLIKQSFRKAKSELLFLMLCGSLSGVVIFLQPRFIITLVFILLCFLYKVVSLKSLFKFLAVFILFSILLPLILVFRNYIAHDTFTISNNLGTTLNIGAGDFASGSYLDKTSGVECNLFGSQAAQDKQLNKCVLVWYLENAEKIPKLLVNKSVYFWSPWSGPLANGTMQRNPWLKSYNEQFVERFDLEQIVYSNAGVIFSLIYMILVLVLLVVGFNSAKRMGVIEKRIAWALISTIFISWFISALSIGDHRFRLPILGFCIILQVIGFFKVKERFLKGGIKL
jgi:hypothetical protein